jgi:hypothetical protein
LAKKINIMGTVYKVKKDGYIFDYVSFMGAPLPTARIDGNGNEIPMTVEEIDAYREDYFKEHPEARQDK